MTYLDQHGRSLSLGEKLGEGGEGTVYRLGSEVVKIYHQPLTPDRQRKILAMVAGGAATVKTIAAWPTGTVHRDVPGRPICGFSMPHAKGDLLHLHYAVKDRKAQFPREHWDFLVRVGQNLAAAVAILHEQGIVIGDINESLVMVDQRSSQVCLVDCDSFQVPDGAITHFCHVGTPDYTPPELMGKPFSGLTRTKEHDAFGLAVLLFKLLLGGRHPFDGRTPDNLQLIKRIERYLYAYGDRTGIQPPSLGVRTDILPSVMQNYFKRAFAPPRGPQGTRPTAVDWYGGLKNLFGNLKQCALEPAHKYFQALPSCPWCEYERQGVQHYLPSPVPKAATKKFDIAVLWQRICAIPIPPPPLTLRRQRHPPICPPLSLTPTPMVINRADPGALERERVQRQKRVQAANTRWLALTAQDVGMGDNPFQDKLKEVKRHITDYQTLKAYEDQAKLEFGINRHRAALHHCLENFLIEHASIPGVGPIRKVVLARAGIVTAADLLNRFYLGVPRIGPGVEKNLFGWRDEIIKQFVFDLSQRGGHQVQLLHITKQFDQARQKLEQELLKGLEALTILSRDNSCQQPVADPLVLQAYRELQQAKVDLAYSLQPLPP